MTGNEAVISVRGLVVGFGAATVLDRVALDGLFAMFFAGIGM